MVTSSALPLTSEGLLTQVTAVRCDRLWCNRDRHWFSKTHLQEIIRTSTVTTRTISSNRKDGFCSQMQRTHSCTTGAHLSLLRSSWVGLRVRTVTPLTRVSRLGSRAEYDGQVEFSTVSQRRGGGEGNGGSVGRGGRREEGGGTLHPARKQHDEWKHTRFHNI